MMTGESCRRRPTVTAVWLELSVVGTQGRMYRLVADGSPSATTELPGSEDSCACAIVVPCPTHTSIAHTDAVAALEARASIGTVGDSYDNAMAESVNALYKTELHRNPAALAANGGHWRGLDDLEIATCRWVAWFNDERLHSELGDLTPAEVETAYHHALDQAQAA